MLSVIDFILSIDLLFVLFDQDSNNCSSSDHSISHSLHSEPPSVIRDSRERSRLEPPMLSHHPNHPSHHSVRENSDDEEPEIHQRELMEGQYPFHYLQ